MFIPLHIVVVVSYLSDRRPQAGIDFLWIDLEHRSYEVDAVKWQPVLCRMAGAACMVRVAALEPDLIKKALDIGANTIMVPQINTAEEARRAVEYAKYPPDGSRGVSPMVRLLRRALLNSASPARAH